MSDRLSSLPRIVRTAPAPLGLYLRVGWRDHHQLSNVLLAGPSRIFGAVIDATFIERDKELRHRLAANRLDVILDPKTQASAFPGGYRPAMAKLPWGEERPHTPDDFRSFSGRQRVIKLAEFTVANGFTQVMAPTHLIMSPNDPWFGIDIEACRWLRVELDRRGGKHLPIIYSFTMGGAVFRDSEQRAALVAALSNAPIDALWLKIDEFGAGATPSKLVRYLDAASDFHNLNTPLVADHVGGIPALSLLAFGAVGGIAHGITAKESFSSYAWRNPRDDRGRPPGWRIYFPTLDLMLTRKEAEKLLMSSPRARAIFANRNDIACPRGVVDMLENPVRAFIIQRADEVASLSVIPESLRPQQFLDNHVRPTTDRALTATRVTWDENDPIGAKLAKRLSGHRKKLDDLRIALGARARRTPPSSFSLQPLTRIAREGNG